MGNIVIGICNRWILALDWSSRASDHLFQPIGEQIWPPAPANGGAYLTTCSSHWGSRSDHLFQPMGEQIWLLVPANGGADLTTCSSQWGSISDHLFQPMGVHIWLLVPANGGADLTTCSNHWGSRSDYLFQPMGEHIWPSVLANGGAYLTTCSSQWRSRSDHLFQPMGEQIWLLVPANGGAYLTICSSQWGCISDYLFHLMGVHIWLLVPANGGADLTTCSRQYRADNTIRQRCLCSLVVAPKAIPFDIFQLQDRKFVALAISPSLNFLKRRLSRGRICPADLSTSIQSPGSLPAPSGDRQQTLNYIPVYFAQNWEGRKVLLSGQLLLYTGVRGIVL